VVGQASNRSTAGTRRSQRVRWDAALDKPTSWSANRPPAGGGLCSSDPLALIPIGAVAWWIGSGRPRISNLLCFGWDRSHACRVQASRVSRRGGHPCHRHHDPRGQPYVRLPATGAEGEEVQLALESVAVAHEWVEEGRKLGPRDLESSGRGRRHLHNEGSGRRRSTLA
jgi:hypothetical protein